MNPNVTQAIMDKLKTIHPRVYYERVPKELTCNSKSGKKVVFPYIVYNFGTEIPEENKSLVPLRINIWENKGNNIVELERITDAVYSQLRKYGIGDKEYLIYLNQNGITSPPDPEKFIRRREVSFIITYYDRRR